jgi:hypothetical protein
MVDAERTDGQGDLLVGKGASKGCPSRWSGLIATNPFESLVVNLTRVLGVAGKLGDSVTDAEASSPRTQR